MHPCLLTLFTQNQFDLRFPSKEHLHMKLLLQVGNGLIAQILLPAFPIAHPAVDTVKGLFKIYKTGKGILLSTHAILYNGCKCKNVILAAPDIS